MVFHLERNSDNFPSLLCVFSVTHSMCCVCPLCLSSQWMQGISWYLMSGTFYIFDCCSHSLIAGGAWPLSLQKPVYTVHLLQAMTVTPSQKWSANMDSHQRFSLQGMRVPLHKHRQQRLHVKEPQNQKRVPVQWLMRVSKFVTAFDS